MLGLRMAVAVAAVVLGAWNSLGGWAVSTVENPPAALHSGVSYRIEFTVRQHGSNLLSGLHPRVRLLDAAGGGFAEAIADVAATESGGEGRYAASIEVPRADSVRLVIATGFGRGRQTELTLMPVPVLPSGASAPKLSAAERGHRLFIAKGCGTCHVNDAVPEWAEWNEGGKVGPDLTGRRLEAQYVRQRLTDPSSLPAIGQGNVRMPNLGLAETEVAALVALLSGPRETATK
jgi:mono/diheme cytochrome c family protein